MVNNVQRLSRKRVFLVSKKILKETKHRGNMFGSSKESQNDKNASIKPGASKSN